MTTPVGADRRHRHQHDLVKWLQLADSVDDSRRVYAKALTGLVDHGGNGLLGHAGVVLEFHG